MIDKLKIIIVTTIGFIFLILVVFIFIPESATDNFVPGVILFLRLNQTPDYHINLRDISILPGYPSDYKLNLKDYYYNLKIIGQDEKNILFTGKILYVNTIMPLDGLNSGSVLGSASTDVLAPKMVPMDEIILALPYYKNAKKIVLLNNGDEIQFELKLDQYKLSVPTANENFCGNNICDSNENVISCFADCRYQIGELKETFTTKLLP